MNSKMTEKEFRARMSFFSLNRESTTLEDDAVAVAREAGLEFAPEPVKLPERLEINSSGGRSRAQVVGPGKAWCFELIEVSPDLAAAQGGMQEQRKAVFFAAVDRYNAYPGLYAAAEGLLDDYRGRVTRRDRYLAVVALEDAMAKGSKP